MYKKLKPPSHDNGDIVDQTYLDSKLRPSMDVKQIGIERRNLGKITNRVLMFALKKVGR